MVQGSAVHCSMVADFYNEFVNREPPNHEPLNHASACLSHDSHGSAEFTPSLPKGSPQAGQNPRDQGL